MKKNTNCLEGFKCPECGSLEPFRITITTGVLMYDEGSDDDKMNADQTWDDDSYCQCYNNDCGFEGTVADFQVKKSKVKKVRVGLIPEADATLETRTAPAWAWATIDETLSMDSESGSFDSDLREEIHAALTAMTGDGR